MLVCPLEKFEMSLYQAKPAKIRNLFNSTQTSMIKIIKFIHFANLRRGNCLNE